MGPVFPMCEWNPSVWCFLCVSGICGFGVPYVWVEPLGSVFPMRLNLQGDCSLCGGNLRVRSSLLPQV